MEIKHLLYMGLLKAFISVDIFFFNYKDPEINQNIFRYSITEV